MIILEIIVVLAGNYYCISTYDNNDDKLYRVEVKRMINDIENGKAVQKNNASENPEYAVDQTLYPHIISVRLFDPNDKNSNPYTVESVRGKLYRFDYKTDISYAPIIYMNVVFGIMLIFTIVVFI